MTSHFQRSEKEPADRMNSSFPIVLISAWGKALLNIKVFGFYDI